ncbi:hypothetical protein M5689_018851 [Euphorbia peplus]|nr:hypothetical protein M5689_018851 [Euphorbia peplus]
MSACKASIPIATKPAESSSSSKSRRLLVLSLPLCASFSFCSPLLVSSFSPLEAIADSYEPVTQAEREASAILSLRISEALNLLEKGKDLQAQGDFPSALLCFTQVIENYKDFAFSEYARVGRALALYEVGDKEEAIAEMEDVSISLKGYPEVHAALAAALYVDKHAPLLAENQFTIATLLDPHYTDLSYVKDTKHWPPSLVTSLRRFITLS